MSKHSLHHQESRIVQARERWDADASDHELSLVVRNTRKLHKAAIHLAHRASLEDQAYS
jgi:hypothetical protein